MVYKNHIIEYNLNGFDEFTVFLDGKPKMFATRDEAENYIDNKEEKNGAV